MTADRVCNALFVCIGNFACSTDNLAELTPSAAAFFERLDFSRVDRTTATLLRRELST
jgi:hypothetical protein